MRDFSARSKLNSVALPSVNTKHCLRLNRNQYPVLLNIVTINFFFCSFGWLVDPLFCLPAVDFPRYKIYGYTKLEIEKRNICCTSAKCRQKIDYYYCNRSNIHNTYVMQLRLVLVSARYFRRFSIKNENY